jgi:CBS domain containing-hemolysin-like protein
MSLMGIWILVSMLLSAFFSGMEIAFVSSNKLKIEVDKNKGKLSARILSFFQNKSSNFIATLLLGNNVALVVYGIYMEKMLEMPISAILPEALDTSFMHLLLETIVSTLIILIFSEFLPKVLFRLYSNRILSFFTLPVSIIYAVLWPIVKMFIFLSEMILKLFFRVQLEERKYAFSSTDVDHYVKEFSTETVEEEAQEDIKLLHKALEFQSVKVRECMIPRPEIHALEKTASLQEAQQLMIETGHSKLLIYEEDIDHIIGYIHSFDLFKNPRSIEGILRDISFAPESMQGSELLSRMTKEQRSIAVVLDEFGGTSGMLTLEDLMEEIFGEIEDEHDTDEFKEEQISDDSWLFSARLEIDYINEKYNLDLAESEEYETLGGYVIQHYENIPQKDQEIEIDEFRIVIIEATDAKIETIRLERNSND